MANSINSSGAVDLTNQLAMDANGLSSLKRSAKADSPEAIKGVAKQFEAVFVNMMLKSMRDATPKEGPFDSEQSKMFTSMLDQQLSQKMADKGIGLADVLVRQLTKAKSGAANIAKDGSPIPLVNNFHTLNAVKSTSTLNAAKVESNPGAGNAAKSSKIKAYQAAAAQAPNVPVARDATLEAVLNTALDRSDDIEDADQTMFSVNAQLNEIAQPWIKDALGKLDQASGELKANVSDAIKNQIPPMGMGLVDKVTTAASVVAKDIASGSFVNRMAAHAQKASLETGLPAHFMMGQAALETGWGKKQINGLDGLPSNNLFGIKANASWTGKVVTVQTSEYINGIKQPRIEKFRAYDSYAESFKDFANMIKNSPRYQNVMNNLQSVTSYAQAIQNAGYSTDPQYASKLASTIKQVNP